MSKRFLYFTACAIWGIPCIIITAKGIYSYTTVSEDQLWWLLTITASVLAGFMFMFRNIVCKYSERVASAVLFVRNSYNGKPSVAPK